MTLHLSHMGLTEGLTFIFFYLYVDFECALGGIYFGRPAPPFATLP